MANPLDDLLGGSSEPAVVIKSGGRPIVDPDPLKTLLLKGIVPDAKGRKQVNRVAAVMGMTPQAFNSAFSRRRFSYHALKALERNSDGRIAWTELEKYCI